MPLDNFPDNFKRCNRFNPEQSYPLLSVKDNRALERQLQSQISATEPTLIQHAGGSVAQLAMAVAPHAQVFWVACGPGLNGADGLAAADDLKQRGKTVCVTRAQDQNPPPVDCEVCIDALLGIGVNREVDGAMRQTIDRINQFRAQRQGIVISIDVPSGLNADTGQCWGSAVHAHHTLSMLSLKLGLLTAQGRDHAGDIWLAPLNVEGQAFTCKSIGKPISHTRPYASHKGSYGELTVVGGRHGMTGAALLAARSALYRGAGRVHVCLIGSGHIDPDKASSQDLDTTEPGLMFRSLDDLLQHNTPQSTIVCGCGGGTDITHILPAVMSRAQNLVLDADALNALALDVSLQKILRQRKLRHKATVLTPHPLEAARLLGIATPQVQEDRLASAQKLSEKFQCTVVLKGSGTLVAEPGQTAAINPTGNALLATAGTGDVLAGWIGAYMAQGLEAYGAACAAVWSHGRVADHWSLGSQGPLTASKLACASSG